MNARKVKARATSTQRTAASIRRRQAARRQERAAQKRRADSLVLPPQGHPGVFNVGAQAFLVFVNFHLARPAAKPPFVLSQIAAYPPEDIGGGPGGWTWSEQVAADCWIAYTVPPNADLEFMARTVDMTAGEMAKRAIEHGGYRLLSPEAIALIQEHAERQRRLHGKSKASARRTV